MFKKALVATVFAAASLVGSSAHALNIDLGFIMDRSGSVGSQFPSAMDALADALGTALLPTIGGPDTYTVSVVTFGSGATVKVAPRVIDSEAALTGLVADIKAGNGNGSGLTNYTEAFTTLDGAFATLGDKSLINMMTDGVPTTGGSGTDGLYGTSTLQNRGWDSLSFESVGSGANSTLLQGICFGPGNAPGDGTDCPVYTSGAQITDPGTAPFVLELPNFAAYNAVIGAKVAAIVGPGPEIPVVGTLPLLASALGLMGLVRRRPHAAA